MGGICGTEQSHKRGKASNVGRSIKGLTLRGYVCLFWKKKGTHKVHCKLHISGEGSKKSIQEFRTWLTDTLASEDIPSAFGSMDLWGGGQYGSLGRTGTTGLGRFKLTSATSYVGWAYCLTSETQFPQLIFIVIFISHSYHKV